MNFIFHAKCTSLSLTFCTPPFPTSGMLIKGASQVPVGFSVEVEIVLLRTHEVKRNVGKGTPTNRIMRSTGVLRRHPSVYMYSWVQFPVTAYLDRGLSV